MFEETLFWASMNTWFTPTVLFVLLNLTIVTIAVTSSFASKSNPPKHQNSKDDDHDHPQHPNLARSPSLLHRLKSINLYSYRSPTPYAAAAVKSSPPQIETRFHESDSEEDSDPEPEGVQAVEESDRTLDEVYGMIQGRRQVTRAKSDTNPAAGDAPVPLRRRMRKSASVKSEFKHFPADDAAEALRPATVREGKAAEHLTGGGVDQEVDATADDFINRFRQQLKLQRKFKIWWRKRTHEMGKMKLTWRSNVAACS